MHVLQNWIPSWPLASVTSLCRSCFGRSGTRLDDLVISEDVGLVVEDRWDFLQQPQGSGARRRAQCSIFFRSSRGTKQVPKAVQPRKTWHWHMELFCNLRLLIKRSFGMTIGWKTTKMIIRLTKWEKLPMVIWRPGILNPQVLGKVFNKFLSWTSSRVTSCADQVALPLQPASPFSWRVKIWHVKSPSSLVSWLPSWLLDGRGMCAKRHWAPTLLRTSSWYRSVNT